jgi:hypothetical protein
MSIATCTKCGDFVDTDLDGDFYYDTLEDGTEYLTKGICQNCKERDKHYHGIV